VCVCVCVCVLSLYIYTHTHTHPHTHTHTHYLHYTHTHTHTHTHTNTHTQKMEQRETMVCDLCSVLTATHDCESCPFLADKDRFQVLLFSYYLVLGIRVSLGVKFLADRPDPNTVIHIIPGLLQAVQ